MLASFPGGLPLGSPFGADAGAIDPSAAAWHEATRAAGGFVSQGRAALDDRLLRALKAAGVWAKLDALFLLCAESEAGALIDAKRLVPASKIGTPAFQARRGFAFLGAHALDPHYDPATQPLARFERDDAGMGCWLYSRGVLTDRILMGADDANVTTLSSATAGGGIVGACNATAAPSAIAHAVAPGSYAVRRDGGSTGRMFRDGVELGDANSTSAAVESAGLLIGAARGPGGTPTAACDDKLAMAWFGAGLSDAEHAALHQAMAAYMAAVGVTLGSIHDPDAIAFFATAENDGATFSDPARDAYSAFVAGLKADGVWSKLDRFWALCGRDVHAARVCLKSRHKFTEVGGPTHTPGAGYAFNGTSQHINSNFVPSLHQVSYTKDSAHAMVWCREDVASTSSDLGVDDGSASLRITSWRPTNDFQIAVNQSTAGGIGTGILGSVGMTLARRIAATSIKVDRNGVNVATGATNSTSLPTLSVFLAARNNSGSASGYSSRGLAFASLGGALTDAESTSFYARCSTLKLSLNAT